MRQARQEPVAAEASATEVTRKNKAAMDVKEYIPTFRYPKDSDTVEFVRATREDAEAINDLFNRAFGQQRSLAHYLWKYWDNPGGEPFGILARDKESGKYLSTSTGVRKQVWVDQRQVEGILMCETSSDPDARGGGRLFKSVMQGFGVAVNDDQGILWSFGGQSSDEAIKIGKRWFGFRVALELLPWEFRLSMLAFFQRKLGPFRALARPMAALLDPLMRGRWRKVKTSLSFEEIPHFNEEFDELWERYRDRYRVAYWRDAATLNWRYVDIPGFEHRILTGRDGTGKLQGYLVWREWVDRGNRLATVLDLWSGGEVAVIEGLLDQARRRASRTGCVFLRFAVPAGSDEEQAFQRFPETRISPYERVDKVICTPMPGSHPQEQGEEAYRILATVVDGANWFYTQGDCDFLD